MKKRATLILAAFLLATSAFAFELVSVGFQGGAHFGEPRTSPALSPSIRVGPMGGLFFESLFSEDVGVISELLYSQKGGSYVTKSGVTNDFRYDYFNLNAFYKHGIIKIGKVEAMAFVGPSFGLAVGATKTTTINSKETAVNSKSQARGYDFSAVGGLWFDYDADENMTVTLNGRYNFGLLSAEKSTVQTWINTGIEVMLGLKFPI